jgi:hypothetical protein
MTAKRLPGQRAFPFADAPPPEPPAPSIARREIDRRDRERESESSDTGVDIVSSDIHNTPEDTSRPATDETEAT